MHEYEKDEIEEYQYKLRTLNAVMNLEYILNHLIECKRCGARFHDTSMSFSYCLDCRDQREIYRSALGRYNHYTKYYKAKLGHIPKEKQELVDFLQGIISKWENNQPIE